MSIKLNAGWCRGLTLKSVPGSHTRPTSSRVREAIWNAIISRIEVSRMMDLFAGSGAVGIEGLSRGVEEVVFVESFSKAFHLLDDNIKQVKLRAKKQGIDVSISTKNMSSEAFLARESSGKPSYDLLWLDPPYQYVRQFLGSQVDRLIACVSENGMIVCESHADDGEYLADLFVKTDPCFRVEQKKYATTLITMVRKSR